MLHPSISENIAKFIKTHDIVFLANAVALTLRQKRTTELIYGVYCSLFHYPSSIFDCSRRNLQVIVDRFRRFNFDDLFFTRSNLIKCYSQYFNVNSLPSDFGGARTESIVYDKDLLIIGEYSSKCSARIAIMTHEFCLINDYYNTIPGVSHIHSIHKYGDSGSIFISTGDSCKVLDLWVIDGCELKWIKRIRKRLAGYTAAATVNGKLYFGTDFSGRPNYIETLEGQKYFFPKKAYKKFVVALYTILDRYIVSLNDDFAYFGEKKTLSVFDAVDEHFIYCEYIDCLMKGVANNRLESDVALL